MRILATTVVFAAFAVAPFAVQAQLPEVLHGQFTTQSADNLDQTIKAIEQQNTPLWIGYSIPVIDKFSGGWNDSRIAYLEGKGSSSYTSETSRPSFDHANILLRAEAGAITKIRVEAPDRQLDAGNLHFVWLTGVSPDQSVATLASFATSTSTRRLADSAVFAISIHQAPTAIKTLIGFTNSGMELNLREKAAFWLVNQHGHEGFAAVQHLAQTDSDPEFRKKLVFDINIAKDPEALNELIRMAHEDSSPEVRKQAQFWMASKGGKLVAGDLRNAAENDPNEQVRKSAVFALTRLPGDEATTQLIHVVDTSKDPAVRKQAVFWLGQSRDPRALDYLTKLLKQ